ncbi:MAG: ferrous iron transport protein B, partial [Selenomonadales bacterium]|nr:ferrous iron transport protein B [Selenomonadales bacterium]
MAGNPNVGKSVFFAALSGIYREVSNYAGTTVDVGCARLGHDTLIDTPGVYGIGSASEEERVAREVILSADIVINIVDAVHLPRDLFLTIQLIEMGIPLVVVLNMMDEVEKRGIVIDREKLSQLLGVPVIGASGALGVGIDEVKRSIGSARTGRIDDDMRAMLAEAMAEGLPQRTALLSLEEDASPCGQDAKKGGVLSWDMMSCGRCKGYKHFLPSLREEIYMHRRARANRICQAVVTVPSHRTAFGARLGRLTVAPISGMAILSLVVAMLYLFVGVFVAQDVVNVTEGFFTAVYEPSVRALAASYISADTVLFSLLVGEYGHFTMTVTYLFGLILPLVAGCCLALAVLEDSGYLPRLAALVDRLMSMIGLNGRAVIPLILGFGCVTMATTATRVMTTERERTIVCTLLGLVVPCSAQMGIIAALLARLPAEQIAVYVTAMVAVFFIAGKMLSLFVGGQTSDLFIDLPPLRSPQAKNIMQ